MYLDDLRENWELYQKIAARKRLSARENEILDALKEKYEIRPDGTVRTQAELSQLLGKDRRTIIRWKKDGMPVEASGGYDPIKVIVWMSDLMDKADESGEISESKRWDIAFRKFRAKIAEQEYNRITGRSIDLAIVEDLLTERVVEFKKSLLSRGRRIAPLLVNKSAEEICQVLDDDALDILSTYSRPSSAIEEAKSKLAAAQESDAVDIKEGVINENI